MQEYVVSESKVPPLTSAFFITEKIMHDIELDHQNIYKTQTEAAMNEHVIKRHTASAKRKQQTSALSAIVSNDDSDASTINNSPFNSRQ